MGYVAESSIAGEAVQGVGRFHWTYGLGTVCVLVFFVAVTGVVWRLGREFAILEPWWMPLPVLGLGLFVALGRTLERRYTEIVVTSRRLVYKRGWVARSMEEIPLERLEQISVEQSFGQRVLGSGRVRLRGMGMGEIVLPVIARPVDFRRAVEGAKAALEQARLAPRGPRGEVEGPGLAIRDVTRV